MIDNNKLRIVQTSDGSNTLFIENLQETYHSSHGAIQEAVHVFISNGLAKYQNHPIQVLEIGFGTGLNALLSALYAAENKIEITFTSVDNHPISLDIIKQLSYVDLIKNTTTLLNTIELNTLFNQLHTTDWNKDMPINHNFTLHKLLGDIHQLNFAQNQYDVIFFDAFGKRAQPDMWTLPIFEKLYTTLKPNGLLTTYASNGDLQRGLKACGFDVHKLPGPAGKREMVNAWK